ncbi:MAG: hypothetical protein M3286_05605 [Thermoproteota archaeon]|nr:hypothetical protein [Thermoproteota archaeon]
MNFTTQIPLDTSEMLALGWQREDMMMQTIGVIIFFASFLPRQPPSNPSSF